MRRKVALKAVFVLACSAALGIAGSCREEPTGPAGRALCVSETGWFALGWGGLSPAVNVTNCGGGGALDWVVEKENDWLTLSSSSGATPGSFRMTAAANETEQLRTDTVRVIAPGVSGPPKMIVVSQAAGVATLCVSMAEWEAPPEGATSAVIEATNCGTETSFNWSATKNVDWLTVSRTDGTTPGSFSITVAPNFSGADRSGSVVMRVAGISGSPKTIAVKQPFSLLAIRRDYEVGYGPVSLAMADFDGDGDPDVAVANSESYSGVYTISVFENFSRGPATLAKRGSGIESGHHGF